MAPTIDPLPFEIIAFASDVRGLASVDLAADAAAGERSCDSGTALQVSVVAATDLPAHACSYGHVELVTADERRICEVASEALVVRFGGEKGPRRTLAALASRIGRLVEHGAAAISLPAAGKLVGRTALSASLLPALSSSDGWLSLFVQQYAVSDGASVWCHTHGLAHLGIPDLEARAAAPDLAIAERLIQAAIDHLLAGGTLDAGALVDVIERGDTPAFQFLVYPARAITGHDYGPLGALQLVAVANTEPLTAG